ncbi:metalloprotease TldD [uncultured Brevundimonas sp.]|uniref:metalloprotease TldD n=1 Tax=uncultured Brevundimonas sp. TaxID=213418 RepID=UPI0030EF06FD|tara:strand:- start:46120 stop:47550 length:1431 start_codon:yes stop_codon:yes gene_type:complete
MTVSVSPPPILESAGVATDEALTVLQDALRGADDGELFLERSESESLVFDDGRLKAATYDATEGFGLRVVAGETAGYAHANEISAAAIRRAADSAALAKHGHAGTVAEGPRATNQKLYGDLDPLASPAFSDKIALLGEIDAWARSRDPRIVQVSASLVGERRAIEILRADGRLVQDVRPLVRLNVSVTVERNGVRESASSGAGGRAGFETWIVPAHWQGQVDEALRQALINLDAVDCPAGEMDVVLGAGWPGVLLHEAVGHGFEGDFHRKGSSVFSGKMGQRVAAPGVTVVDDGSITGRRGSLSVDDEGTPTSRTVLIEDGIMVGLMHDRLSARQLGQNATGNGRRQSFAHMPMPRMTNTFMEGGTAKQADMIASTKRGLYAANFGGGQVDITNGKFVFQCTEAYLIEDGKITAPVRGATLIGDGATALTNITMIGDDFAFDPGVGVCGKGGQGVPVGIGQPSLKIGGLTVGGTAV